MDGIKCKNSAMLGRYKNRITEKKENPSNVRFWPARSGPHSSHCGEVQEVLKKSPRRPSAESEVEILVTGCMGTCAAGPAPSGGTDGIFYTAMNSQR